MNRVLLTGRLTRDPEMRALANSKVVTQFSIATNEYRGGQEKAEFQSKGKGLACFVDSAEFGPRWFTRD